MIKLKYFSLKIQMNTTNLFQKELNPNENLLWYGKPKQGILLRASDKTQIPFSILWAGFAFFYEYNALTKTDDLFHQLWGVPFVIIGIHMLIGRFFYDSYQRKFTDYAVTNERIIIATGNHNKSFKSILLKNLPQLQFISHEDTYGTIIFDDNDVFSKFFMQFPYQKDTTPKFEYVKNCDEPYRIIKELVNKN